MPVIVPVIKVSPHTGVGRPTDVRGRLRVGVADERTVGSARISTGVIEPVWIAGENRTDIGVAAGLRIGQLVAIMAGAGKYRPLVDEIALDHRAARSSDFHSGCATAISAEAGAAGGRWPHHAKPRRRGNCKRGEISQHLSSPSERAGRISEV
jgi:hypothetical protein